MRIKSWEEFTNETGFFWISSAQVKYYKRKKIHKLIIHTCKFDYEKTMHWTQQNFVGRLKRKRQEKKRREKSWQNNKKHTIHTTKERYKKSTQWTDNVWQSNIIDKLTKNFQHSNKHGDG